jgi:DNA-binding NarL/FixJ family response regulator
MNKTRVLLAEDHTIVRKGLRSLLESAPGINVVGEAADGRQAVDKVRQLSPDIVLMDISMPGLNGLEATRQIRQRFPGTKVLILTMHADEEYILQILQAGALGYVVKQAAPEELISAVEAVSHGQVFLSPAISRTVLQEYLRRAEAMTGQDSYDTLTPREREVLQLIAEGHPPREIAETLCISIKTVETHRAHLRHKLDAHSTAELIRYAIRKGIVGTA